MTTHIIVLHVAVYIRARHATAPNNGCMSDYVFHGATIKKTDKLLSINKCVRVCKLPKTLSYHHFIFMLCKGHDTLCTRGSLVAQCETRQDKPPGPRVGT